MLLPLERKADCFTAESVSSEVEIVVVVVVVVAFVVSGTHSSSSVPPSRQSSTPLQTRSFPMQIRFSRHQNPKEDNFEDGVSGGGSDVLGGDGVSVPRGSAVAFAGKSVGVSGGGAVAFSDGGVVFGCCGIFSCDSDENDSGGEDDDSRGDGDDSGDDSVDGDDESGVPDKSKGDDDEEEDDVDEAGEETCSGKLSFSSLIEVLSLIRMAMSSASSRTIEGGASDVEKYGIATKSSISEVFVAFCDGGSETPSRASSSSSSTGSSTLEVSDRHCLSDSDFSWAKAVTRTTRLRGRFLKTTY